MVGFGTNPIRNGDLNGLKLEYTDLQKCGELRSSPHFVDLLRIWRQVLKNYQGHMGCAEFSELFIFVIEIFQIHLDDPQKLMSRALCTDFWDQFWPKIEPVVPWVVVGTPNAWKIRGERMVSIYDHFRNDFHEQKHQIWCKINVRRKINVSPQN